MAYDNQTPVQRMMLTPEMIHSVQAITENHWKDHEIAMIWDQQDARLPFPEFQRFMLIAHKRNLDPMLRQIYSQVRTSKNEIKVQIEATIDGFRLCADRTGQLDGMSAPVFAERTVVRADENGQAKEFLEVISCSMSVYRKGCSQPFTAVAYYNEYAYDMFGKPISMYARMPHTMLAKVCEALVLRKAFSEALSGLYTREEMMQSDEPAPYVPAAVPPPANAVPLSQVNSGFVPPAPVVIPGTVVPNAQDPYRQNQVVTSQPVAPPAQPVTPEPQPAPAPARRGRPRKTEEPAPAVAPPPPPPPPVQTAPPAEAPALDKFVCSDSGQAIIDWVDPTTGATWTRDQIYEISMRNYRRPLSAERMLQLRQESAAKPPVQASPVADQATQILNGMASQ